MKLKSRKEYYDIDPLLPEVLEFAVVQQILSITSIQRAFQIGYPRAAKLMDRLVEEGLVDSANDGPKKVLVSKKEYCRAYRILPSRLKEVENRVSTSPKPRKGTVRLEKLKLDKVKFYDEFDKVVDEECQKELNKILLDILCQEALVNLSSDFLLDFLRKKKYKVKYLRLNLDDISGIFRAVEKINSPVIYVIDVATGNVMEILEQTNLLVIEGAIVMRKNDDEQSRLTIFY